MWMSMGTRFGIFNIRILIFDFGFVISLISNLVHGLPSGTFLGNWTWVGGSSNVNDPGSYGTEGIMNIDTWPHARNMHTMSIDSINQNLYVFGGYWFEQVGSNTELGKEASFVKL